MNKKVVFAPQASKELVEGINILTNAVKTTLGPKGRKVIIETIYGRPHATKDGVTVANSINLEDPTQNLGVQIVKQAAAKTLEQCGDGTTTATVLAGSIINKGLKYIESGINPTSLAEGMQAAYNTIVDHVLENSKQVKDSKTAIMDVASISANNDRELGRIISSAINMVGKDGVVLVQESKTIDTYISEIDGIKFDRSYISPYFITNQSKQTVELEDPYILIYDKKIRAASELVPILEQVASKSRPLLIVAEDVESQALSLLIINKMRGNLQAAAIKAPGYGDRRQKSLEDLAVATGATLISESMSRTISSVSLKDLGSASRVIIDRQNTTIIEAKGNPEAVAQRVEQIRGELEVAATGWEKEKNKERLAQLGAKMAVIHIGAVTEAELKEKKDRVDDALHATQAAIEFGIVEGCGLALARASQADFTVRPDDISYNAGIKIITEAVLTPSMEIIRNGGKSPEVIVNKCLTENIGYNAATDKWENLFESGVIDPYIVPITALKTAISVASLILSSEVTVVNSGPLMDAGHPDIDTSRLTDF
jgi:chaperonin GroEL